MDNLNAQIGPIYGVCPDNEDLKNLMNKESVKLPLYSFDALDECKHEMWIIKEQNKINKICKLFDKIERIYIADGHHRIASSSIYQQSKHNHFLSNYFLSFFIDQKELKIFVGIFLCLAASRFIPHPWNFTSLLALSFYVPSLLGIRYIPFLIIGTTPTDEPVNT